MMMMMIPRDLSLYASNIEIQRNTGLVPLS
jgi:hypothetical protein